MGELSRQEIDSIFDRHDTPEHIRRHCEQVRTVAVRLATALNSNSTGFDLDISAIHNAAALHDVLRTKDDHAALGAKLLSDIDPKAADIILAHMNHDLSEDLIDIDEKDIVALADRSVYEDEYIGFEKRMTKILDGFKDRPEAFRIIKSRIAATRSLIEQIEASTQKSMDNIANGGMVNITKLLPRVERPGRYVGGEINSIYKDVADIGVRFAFAFPDLYEIGMSFTGLQILYSMMNEDEDIYCERTFLPQLDMQDLMRENDIPLFTLETKTPLRLMDMVGFTLQYELSYTNIFAMLDLAGIPFYSKDRQLDAVLGDEAGYPLIVAGGPNSYNPEPLADVIDVYLIGDGEGLNDKFCHLYLDAKNRGLSKRTFLVEMATKHRLDGVYIPSLYEPIYEEVDSQIVVNCSHNSDNFLQFAGFKKLVSGLPDRVKANRIDDLDAAYFPQSPIVPLIDTVHERAICEIMRGCPRGCRFCQAGYMYRPVRSRSPKKVKEIVDKQLENTGYDEVSLLSLSTGDYPGIEALVLDLMDELRSKNVSLSLPSMRLDTISDQALQRISEYKKTGLTFAPEAGSQRLRDVIHKNITEDIILDGVERVAKLGYNKAKLYFMLGLPTETYEDIDAIAELCKLIMKTARQHNKSFNLTVSVSNFVPKPNTPFGWARGEEEEALLAKNYYLKDKLRAVKGVNYQFHDTRLSALEMLLAKADRRVAKVIENAYHRGCMLDAWREHFKYDEWMAAFEDEGLLYIKDLYTQPSLPLPWGIVDTLVDVDLLKMHYEKAVQQ